VGYGQDLDLQCYKGLHLRLALLLGLPGVVFFCIGVPLSAALFLRRNQNRLDKEEFQGVFGFLYEVCPRIGTPTHDAWQIHAQSG
jgi:hypothetical protein